MPTALDQLIYHLKRPYHLLKTGLLRALPAQLKTGFPARKLKIIAVTGTDGKTTSSTLIYHLLKSAGKKAGLISTVAAYIGREELETGLHVTSPDPRQLQQILQKMVEANLEYVVLEVTSHGAYQARTAGIKPDYAALTNLAHEHLDYHLKPEFYLQAKAIILNKAKKVVLNADDSYYQKLRQQLHQPANQILTYSQESALPKSVLAAAKKRFVESYNWQNTRLAYTVVKDIGLTDQEIAQGLADFPSIPGRMEELETDQPFRVFIDFAHTPQAIEAALTSLQKQLHKSQGSGRSKKIGRLIAVYGAAGRRDQSKRPLMGKIGAELADLVIFTAEDPRTENVWTIIRMLKQDIHENINRVLSIPDRRRAIEFALKELAQEGDIIAILGKGHEQSMCYGTQERPWSDVTVTKEILAQL